MSLAHATILQMVQLNHKKGFAFVFAQDTFHLFFSVVYGYAIYDGG